MEKMSIAAQVAETTKINIFRRDAILNEFIEDNYPLIINAIKEFASRSPKNVLYIEPINRETDDEFSSNERNIIYHCFATKLQKDGFDTKIASDGIHVSWKI